MFPRYDVKFRLAERLLEPKFEKQDDIDYYFNKEDEMVFCFIDGQMQSVEYTNEEFEENVKKGNWIIVNEDN